MIVHLAGFLKYFLVKIERAFAFPNKWTFTIKPIKKLLQEEMTDGLWVDPYSGMNSPATITNDINPDMPTKYHLDALEFVNQFENNTIDGVLLDPPYSVRQISECYKNIGLKVDQHTTQSSWYSNVYNTILPKLKIGSKIIKFGWNSNGIGKKGFRFERILLVAHGHYHNDTIVTVERKVNGVLF